MICERGDGKQVFIIGFSMNETKEMKRRIYILISIMLIIPGGMNLSAQKGDTLSLYRSFMKLNNAYKTMPLYLEAGIRKTDSFVTSPEDTSFTPAVFYISNTNAYLKAGEFEQVIGDSMALLIDNNLQHMILYTEAAPIIKQMRAAMGITAFPDSSIRYLADRYSARALPAVNGTGIIELEGRDLIQGTKLTREIIEMRYDEDKDEPQIVRTVKRVFQPVDSATYHTIEKDSKNAGRLLQTDNWYFFIRELVTDYVFDKIDHSPAYPVPVFVHDRVVRNGDGEFVPVKEYAHYKLTVNN